MRHRAPCKLNNVSKSAPRPNGKSLAGLVTQRTKSSCKFFWELESTRFWFSLSQWRIIPTQSKYNILRVWSWLRTNAGGVPNTCKSNGVKRNTVCFAMHNAKCIMHNWGRRKTKERDNNYGLWIMNYGLWSETQSVSLHLVADGWVTREQPAPECGIAAGNGR